MRKYSKNIKKRAITEEEIGVAMINHDKFEDAVIIQYLGYQGKPEVPMVKIRCSCGHERIVRWAQLKSRKLRHYFKCRGKENEVQPTDDAKVLPEYEITPVYKKKYYDKWLSMNRCCDVNVTMNPKSKYHEKGIKVCPEWRRYRNYPHGMRQENFMAYQNYETYIDNLLKKHGYDSEHLFNGTLRISRINYNRDFEPGNIGLQVIKKGLLLD